MFSTSEMTEGGKGYVSGILSKRMLIMMVAAVLLIVGSLSYFAYASEVEPCGPVLPTRCPSCGGNSYIGEQLLYADVENKTHTYGKGFICEYVVTTTTYGYRCGDCDLISATRSATSETGHSCK